MTSQFPGHTIAMRRALCLPCYPLPNEIDSKKSIRDQPNPLPQLQNLQTAYTIPHIKAYWFPVDVELPLKDWFIFYCHESVHILLADTILGYYTLLLHHFQYAAIVDAIRYNNQISIPSLQELSGKLARAQDALDQILEPVTLIHELMASTLVRFFAEQRVTAMTIQLWGEMKRSLASADLPHDFLQIDEDPHRQNNFWMVSSYPTFAQEVIDAEGNWLPFYASHFPEHDFTQLYHRLLNAWRMIRVEDQLDLFRLIYYMLARYPFQLIPHPNWVSWTSFDSWFEGIAAYLQRMEDEPLRRLESMLTTIENAPNLSGMQEWEFYVGHQLPDMWNALSYPVAEWLRHDIKKIWDFSDQKFYQWSNNLYRGTTASKKPESLADLISDYYQYPYLVWVRLGTLPLAPSCRTSIDRFVING